MQEYADCYGCEAKDVLEWVLSYCNGPWPEGTKVEATERERLESIKWYIEAMVMDSVSRRVKASIRAQKAAGAIK